VPFYYIEYGMAQLGALAVWKNYIADKPTALAQYKSALSLGYTKTIGDIYKTAGIEFNFTAPYIKQLMEFVKVELNKCN
jgi:oligoendopeptidase F